MKIIFDNNTRTGRKPRPKNCKNRTFEKGQAGCAKTLSHSPP